MKKALKVLGIIFGIFVVFMLVMFVSMFMKMGNEMENMVYHEVNLNEIDDGIYIGTSETTLVKAEVNVEVKDHEIIEIDLVEHQNGLGSEAEAIIKDIVNQNTYEVDAISGATASSEVIKSAVSDALKGKVSE